MQLVHTLAPFPAAVTRSVFLAGPTPRSREIASWRPAAIEALAAAGWDGHVFVPEGKDGPGQTPSAGATSLPRSAGGGRALVEDAPPRGDGWRGCPESEAPGAELDDAAYARQVAWEREGLARADAILCWVPRDMATLPGLTTNVEIGLWATSGKLVLGLPAGAQHVRYLRALAEAEHVPVTATLSEAAAAVVERVGPPLLREGGAAQLPAEVVRSAPFARWRTAQEAAGNQLVRARALFTLRRSPDRRLFATAVKAELFQAADGRTKSEVVLSRPDVASVVLLHRDPAAPQDPARTRVALVREFRCAGATEDGWLREPPSGSPHDPATPPEQAALEEVREETGLELAPERLRPLGARQVAATLLSHVAHAFAVDLTDAEVARLAATADEVHGADACERTWVELWSVAELLRRPVTDWTSVGLVLAAVSSG